MRIKGSDLAFASHNSIFQHHEKEETLRNWIGTKRPNFDDEDKKTSDVPLALQIPSNRALNRPDKVTLSDEALKKRAEATELGKTLPKDISKQSAVKNKDELDEPLDAKSQLLKLMVEMMTGKKISVFNISDLDIQAEKTTERMQMAALQQSGAANDQSQSAGWGMEYSYHEYYHESEKLSVAAHGTIQTADGQTMEFDLSIEMSREFTQETNVQFAAGDGVKKDPLMLNFNGTGAELSDFIFDFDLDVDGQKDQLRMPGKNKGYLVLDKNNDGKINDGSELFGAQSGNGFADLLKLDSDGNNWIDEQDATFNKLQLWSYDVKMGFQLQSLKSKNIGAIYAQSVASPFQLKDASNNSLGEVASTGVYLNEDGKAGAVQQVNVTQQALDQAKQI